jgi:hypothetical protein
VDFGRFSLFQHKSLNALEFPMIRTDIYSAIDYLHQKKIVDRLRFSALMIVVALDQKINRLNLAVFNYRALYLKCILFCNVFMCQWSLAETVM